MRLEELVGKHVKIVDVSDDRIVIEVNGRTVEIVAICTSNVAEPVACESRLVAR